MDLKKIGKALAFPCTAVMILLIPISLGFLLFSMLKLGTKSVVSIMSYVLASYTLTVWCMKIPKLIRIIKKFRQENKYLRHLREDTRLRVNLSLYGSLIWNTAYAALQLGMGIWHRSFWFSSLAGYYILLAALRFFLVRHTRKHKPGELMREELLKYRICGIVFLAMNLSLSLMVFFMIYWNRTFYHHEITTIALAAYTFTSLTLAIINTIKYRRYNSPVYSASKAISLAAGCVSMLTLESTMLTTFGKGTMTLTGKRLFLGLSGGAISAFIIAMAIYMIITSNRKIRLLSSEE